MKEACITRRLFQTNRKKEKRKKIEVSSQDKEEHHRGLELLKMKAASSDSDSGEDKDSHCSSPVRVMQTSPQPGDPGTIPVPVDR